MSYNEDLGQLRTYLEQAEQLSQVRAVYLAHPRDFSAQAQQVPDHFGGIRSMMMAGNKERSDAAFMTARQDLVHNLTKVVGPRLVESGGGWEQSALVERDPLQPHARSARRGLMAGAGFVLFVAATGEFPDDIPLLGLSSISQRGVTLAVTGFLAYSVIAFFAYSHHARGARHREIAALGRVRTEHKALAKRIKELNAAYVLEAADVAVSLSKIHTSLRRRATSYTWDLCVAWLHLAFDFYAPWLVGLAAGIAALTW